MPFSNGLSIGPYKIIEEIGLVDDLYTFLRNPIETPELKTTEIAQKWAERLVKESYPLHFEILENLHSELSTFAPRVLSKDLDKWEERHSDRIVYCAGIIKSPAVLSNTMGEFKWWPVLTGRSLIGGVRLSFLTSSDKKEEDKNILKQFINEINSDARIRVKLKAFNRKLVFIDEDSSNPGEKKNRETSSAIYNQFIDNTEDVSKKIHALLGDFTNVWVYRMKAPIVNKDIPSKYFIVLKDRYDSSDNNGLENASVNCNWKDTDKWVDLILELWPDLKGI